MVHQTVLVALATIMQPSGAVQSLKPFTSPKGGYTVSLPTKPTEKKQTLTLPGGRKAEMTIASVKRGLHSYSVSSGELDSDPDDTAAILDAARDDLVKVLKGKLVDETPCELGGGPGRELKIEIPKTVAAGDAVGRARISLVGRRLYELIAVQPAAAETVDRFFASFKPAAKPVATADVAAQAGKPDSKTKVAVEPKAAAKPAALGPEWKEFSPPDKAFTAYFPGDPVEQKITLQTPIGPQEDMTYSQKQGDVFYMTTAQLLPGGLVPKAGQVDDFFMGYKNGVLRSMQATAKSDRRFTLDGHPALEMIAEIPPKPGTNFPDGASYRGRGYLVGNRSYTMAAVSPKGAPPPKEIDGYLDAFRLRPDGPIELAMPKTATGLAEPDSARPGWEKFASADGGYSVLMPGKARETAQKINAPPLGQVEIHVGAFNKGPHEAFMVVYNDYADGLVPMGDIEKIYDGSRQGAMANSGGTLAGEKKVTLGDLPGREIKINLPEAQIPGGGLMQIRYFLKGPRLYQVIAMAPKASFKAEDADAFLDSFQITAK